MFRLLGDIVKTATNVVGTVTGTIIGTSVGIVASTLGITIDAVKEARKAGCESYEEVKEFYKLD